MLSSRIPDKTGVFAERSNRSANSPRSEDRGRALTQTRPLEHTGASSTMVSETRNSPLQKRLSVIPPKFE